MVKYIYDGFNVTKLEREQPATGASESARRSHDTDSGPATAVSSRGTLARARSVISRVVEQVQESLEEEKAPSQSGHSAKQKRRAPALSKSRRQRPRRASVAPTIATPGELARSSLSGEVQVSLPADFDVAISFAKPERAVAEELAVALRERGLTVFYDRFYEEHLWGADLAELFDDVFRRRAKFCIIFVSHEYATRIWTTHERRSATARAVLDRDRHYILPIRIDDTELPGLRSDIGYLSLKESSIDRAVELLLKKLGRQPPAGA